MDPLSKLDELTRALEALHQELVSVHGDMADGPLRAQLGSLADSIGEQKAGFRAACQQTVSDTAAQMASARSTCEQAVEKIAATKKQAEAAKAEAAAKKSPAPDKKPQPHEPDPELGRTLRRELLHRISKKRTGTADDDRDLWELDLRDWDE